MKTKLIIQLMIAVIVVVFIKADFQKSGMIGQAFAEDDKKPKDQKPADQPADQTRRDPLEMFASNLNSKDKALFAAVLKKDLAAVQAAVDDGADVNAKGNGNTTALILAAKKSPDIVKYLLEKKADPNITSNNGITALGIAKKNNLEDVIKMLLDAGAKE